MKQATLVTLTRTRGGRAGGPATDKAEIEPLVTSMMILAATAEPTCRRR
jgi:hypothetical protein